MGMRSMWRMALGRWLAHAKRAQTETAGAPGITQGRVSGNTRGKIRRFRLDLPVRLAARAGLEPKSKLAA